MMSVYSYTFKFKSVIFECVKKCTKQFAENCITYLFFESVIHESVKIKKQWYRKLKLLVIFFTIQIKK